MCLNTLSREEEARIITDARSDPESFAPLYERYYDRIYLYLYRLCSNSSLAEDLTSETFMKALRGLRTYRHGNIPFSSWLYRIAHNSFVSHYRREKVRRLFGAMTEKNSRETSTITNPLRDIEMERVGEKILKFINRLKPRDQFILTMRYFEDMSIGDVALASGLQETNVRTRLHRSLKRLQALIEIEDPNLAAMIEGEA